MECGKEKKFVFFFLLLYIELIEEALGVGGRGGGAARRFSVCRNSAFFVDSVFSLCFSL